MNTGHFYFVVDQYFIDFPDPMLMRNKETINGQQHNRPCFYAFQDPSTKLFWLIPFSSQFQKYKAIYDKKIQKYKTCDTIVFGYVLGDKKAFLIQNMCPVTPKYISNEYIDGNSLPVRINKHLEQELISKSIKVLALQRRGIRLIFPDALAIEVALLSQIS